MDNNYDFEEAAISLHGHAKVRQEEDSNQLVNYDKMQGIQVVPIEKPKCWRIVTSEEEAADIEEVVLNIQGVIVNKNLPPFTHTVAHGRRHFLRQSVQITGLSTPSFQTCIDHLQHIHATFSRHVPEGTLEPFQPSEFLNHPSMDIATRYFTSRREDPTGTAVPFPANVDPKGILRSLAADDYFHGPDNEVLFYNMIKVDGANKNRFTPADPTLFRIGDVVEVQTTVSVVPIKNERFRMIVHLRAIAMLDNKPSLKANIYRLKSNIRAPVFKMPIKRKVGYCDSDDDVNETRRKVNNMVMNDRN